MDKKNITDRRLEAYNEALMYCQQYINYKGDKRRKYYKNLQFTVINYWSLRMNNFGHLLGLPLFSSLYD